MGIARDHRPVKVIVGMICADRGLFGPAENALIAKLGPTDYRTDSLAFAHTNFYDDELGTPLWRKFVSFAQLAPAEALPDIKTMTNELERHWSHRRADKSARRLNLDPGYLTAAKLILATTKDNAHRIFLRDGIYAEITLSFREGQFKPLEWTYPDYRTPEYLAFFTTVRAMYMRQRHEQS